MNLPLFLISDLEIIVLKLVLNMTPITIRINYFGLEGISGWSQVQVRLRRHIIMCGQCVVGVMCVCVCVCDKKNWVHNLRSIRLRQSTILSVLTQ